MYADDISKHAAHKCVIVIERKLKEDLVNSIQWMKCNKLTINLINLRKTQCMLIGTNQKLKTNLILEKYVLLLYCMVHNL